VAKAFSELSEKEILALAISLEEDDSRIYGDYADRLKADYPETAKMLKIMQDEELVHAQRLIDSWRAQFGEHIPFIQRQDVKGFLRRKPLWLAKVLSVQQVRKEVELMELESMRFYQTAAKRTTDLSVRKLLDDLAVAEQLHEDLAGKLNRELEESGARKAEDQTHRRMFVLQVIQPVLRGSWMDLSRRWLPSSRRPLRPGTVGMPSWSAWPLPSAPVLAWVLPKHFPTMVCSVGADVLSFGE
jgi:erythrin-vacuolar iron transport family protein